MRKLVIITLILSGLSLKITQAQSGKDLLLKSASSHPMQYYISLPDGWTATRTWPVVVVLEAAEKEFKKNAQRFVDARGGSPFIIVAPINTNNGNQGRRDVNLFPYSNETWDYMEKVGDCQFNDEGIIQVIKDVSKLYQGESKVYITGFEAGTHILWSIVLNHPEYLKAVAPVAGNFRNRCISESSTQKKPSATGILINSFVGEADQYFGPSGGNYNQWLDAKSLAEKVGYNNIQETIVKGKDHEPLPVEVMGYFYSLIK